VDMTSLVTKLLGRPEHVDACSPSHTCRWMIFGNQRFRVYLHHSSSEDLAVEFSRYPHRFISIGLARSHTNNPCGVLETCRDHATWMVLIARSSEVRQKRTVNDSSLRTSHS
jgi:hypothetical protein